MYSLQGLKLTVLVVLGLTSISTYLIADEISGSNPCILATAEVAPSDSPKNLATVEMYDRFKEKDVRKEVQMFTPEEREAHRIVIKNGIAYDNRGKILPDTANNHFNLANYVMDGAGNFYLFDENLTPTIRHSSIFDEGPVAGAGNITIKNGKIIYVDSDSGHYPTVPLFPQVLVELQDHGVDTSSFHPENLNK